VDICRVSFLFLHLGHKGLFVVFADLEKKL